MPESEKPKRDKKPTLLDVRIGSATLMVKLLLVPIVLLVALFPLLGIWMAFSGLPTIDLLARASPILISAGMIIGMLGFLSGLVLLWFEVKAETALTLKLWLLEFTANTKGIGVIGMILGVGLTWMSLDVITRIVLKENPQLPAVIPSPVIDPSKVIVTEEPKNIPKGTPSAIVPDTPQ